MFGKTAFVCVQCGGEVHARNPLAYKLLMQGKPAKCDKCRQSVPTRHWDKRSYREYLRSSQWRTRRKLALQKAGYACQICKSTNGLQVHHNNYERIGHELDSDLLVSCAEHHGMIHHV